MPNSDRLKVSRVAGLPDTIHAYLDCYYVARLSKLDAWTIDGAGFRTSRDIPTEDEAREVVRMWVEYQSESTGEFD
jgi:hypothetical protein